MLPSARYKDTDQFDVAGTPRLGLFRPPAEFLPERLSVNARMHMIREDEVGALDLIAFRHYGPGSERHWWAIALANGIRDPETDMRAGEKIMLPPTSALQFFESRGPRPSLSAMLNRGSANIFNRTTA